MESDYENDDKIEILTTVTLSNDDFTCKYLQKQSCFEQIFIRNIREIIF